jgi:curved DNA-binding protein CbpA
VPTAVLCCCYCSRYKSLAVRVHPDKNRCAGAEEAFKRLSVAYDCLSVESSQREYLVALQRSRGRSTGAAPASSSSSQPPVRRYHKRKRAANVPTPDNAAQPARQRTPEEIWREFQREEEELARREFLAKGFERVYHEPKRRERSATPSPPSNSPSREQEEVLGTDLDAKATHWATWATRPAKVGRAEEQSTSSPPDNEARQEPPPPNRRQEPTPLVFCLLCRRKFTTREQLERHNAQSTLHATNVAKAAAQDRAQASEQRQ